MSTLETRIFEIVKDARHTIDPNAKTLVLDPELVAVARRRSEDMAAKNYMAHVSPDGQTSATLIMDVDADFEGLLGENIAAQYYVKQSGVDVNTFAQRFVQTWLDSPQHKENLAFAAYDRSGVGAAVNGDTIYVTELFATDLGLPRNPADPKRRKAVAVDHPKSEPTAEMPTLGENVPVPAPRPDIPNTAR